jgi:DNA-directed RNA polymerase subunit RPC12/RpoP
MRNGICVKCGAKTVYFSNAKGIQNGLKTDESQPLINIYKDNKWIPNIDFLAMNYYVCQTCGYFEMFVRDLDKLTKLGDCDNWKKIEGN